MIVTNRNFNDVMDFIHKAKYASLDTETTGLKAYHEDRLFSIIIGIQGYTYYFNFNSEPDHLGVKFPEDEILGREVIPQLCIALKNKTIFMHNAKFDLAMCKKEGLDLSELDIHCTMAMARVEKNDRMNLKLETLAKEIGYEKSEAVNKYCDKHKLYEWETFEGKKKRNKKRFYYLVPKEVIVPYGELDGKITLELGMHQLKRFKEINEARTSKQSSIYNIVDQEKKLTHILFEMETLGIKLDVNYTKNAYNHEKTVFEAKKEEFEKISGMELVDSPKGLEKAFTKMGEPFGKTAKGNASFKDEVLDNMNTPLAKVLKDYRKSYKKAGTYFLAYLDLVGKNEVIHPGFRQAGTVTGRMSSSNPNLQNLEKLEGEKVLKEKNPVRRCFIPREGFFFAMLDYDQIEYRLMLEYAQEMELIEKVKNGLDVHQATANMLGNGIKRSTAKNINFALLYGAGIQKFADMAKISYDSANLLRRIYFQKLPKISQFIKNVTDTATRRGFIFNSFGRVSLFIDKNYVYKSCNSLIQGNAADVMKRAMVDVHEFLKDKKSNMVLSIHDEIVCEIANDEKHIIPEIKRLMESAYPYKYLPLTVGVEYSETSLQDKKEWKL